MKFFSSMLFIATLCLFVTQQARTQDLTNPPKLTEGIEVATYCQGDPVTAKWITFNQGGDAKFLKTQNACYLPLAENSSINPQVIGKAQHHVQVKIQVVSGQNSKDEKIIDLIWPLNC